MLSARRNAKNGCKTSVAAIAMINNKGLKNALL